MDKYEYRVRAEEINALIEQRQYAEAVKIADTIDWRRVKSVTMLCKVSELYKMNRRYEDSKEILLLAYDRQPGSRKIVYSLCELSIKLEELVQAIEYYKEFVQVAPRDTGRFILQYRLYEAQDVSLEERIAVLEEYKKRDYREKWAYELAYLYHRIGLATRCVEECDELILWFGEGKYVIKAMELKMLHVPLSATQQEKYDKRFQSDNTAYMVNTQENTDAAPITQAASRENISSQAADRGVSMETIPSMPIQIKSVEVSNAPTTRIPSKDLEEVPAETIEIPTEKIADEMEEENVSIDMPEIPLAKNDDLDIQVKTLDMGEYNTINLQKELAKNLAQILEQEDMGASDATKAMPVESINILAETEDTEGVAEEELVEEGTDELGEVEELEEIEESVETEEMMDEVTDEIPASYNTDLTMTREVVSEVAKVLGEEKRELITEEDLLHSLQEEPQSVEEEPNEVEELEEIEEAVVIEELPTIAKMIEEPVPVVATPVVAAPIVATPVTPAIAEEEIVNEQITGQLSFEDIMAGWEETKKANEAKHLEEMRRKVMEQTGPMFQDFDEAAKASVQADLALLGPSLDVFDTENEETTETTEVIEELPLTEEIEEETSVSAEEESIEEESTEEIEEAAIEESVQEEPEFKPATFDTAEINGLEEKLMASLMETEKESAITEEPQEIAEEEGTQEAAEEEEIQVSPAEAPKPSVGSETAELEKLIIEALNESDTKSKEIPKGDTGFIFTDLTEEAPVSVPIEESIEEEEPETVKEASTEKTMPVRRTLTRDEKEVFGSIAQTKAVQEEVANAIDNVSLNPCIGNVIITGEKGTGTLDVAKNLVKVFSVHEDAFSKKIAKVTGEALNNRSIEETLNSLGNGALIVEQAGKLEDVTLLALGEGLKKKKEDGILVVLEDTKKEMDALWAQSNMPRQYFDLRIDIAALDNDGLVNYGKEYANEQEYSIDDMGVLALYTRIAEMQTNEHAVTVDEVRDLVDEAIRNSEKKNISHFMDVILAKRYDRDDMIVLREKDFLK